MSNRTQTHNWAGWLGRGALLAGGAAFAVASVRANRRIAALEQLTAEEAAPDGQFVTVEGFRLRYLEAGPPDAPAVVLLHGMASLAETWQPIVAALAGEYHLVAPDLLGLGYSERVDRPIYNLRLRARLITGLMDHLEIARAAVVGNSLGGGVALQLACARPERVKRLVLIDSIGGYQGMNGNPAPWLGQVLRATPLGTLFLAQFLSGDRIARLIALAYHDPARFTPAMRAAYLGPFRVRGTASALLALTATQGDDDLPEGLRRIEAPTLILWGRQDRLIRPHWGERLHTDLPGSRLEWIENCGHLPQEECPAEVVRHLRAFLNPSD